MFTTVTRIDAHTTLATPRHHTLPTSSALHLLPGTLAIGFCVVIKPLVVQAGWPLLMVVNLFALGVIIPFELGVLLTLGVRQNHALSLKGIVLNRQPISWRTLALLVPPLVVWSAFIFAVLSPPIEQFLKHQVFFWMPSWFFALGSLNAHPGVSRAVLLITVGTYLVINPLTAFVEELYFRAYLLPRMTQLKGGAPLVNATLFSLQHWFSPWQNPARLLALVPLVYTVAWKRNLVISVAVHVVLDVLSGIVLLVPLLR